MSSLATPVPAARIATPRIASSVRDERRARSIRPSATASASDGKDKEDDARTESSTSSVSRRRALLGAASLATLAPASIALADEAAMAPPNPRAYFQRYPTLFAPFYGDDERATMLKTVVPDRVWCLEQNLAVGPLETPLRCVVIRLKDDSLWVHAPLAPTEEFFRLIERDIGGRVSNVVVPTYALEHKVFARDACDRWPDADLWIAPGQFAFPVEVAAERIYGRTPAGVLGDVASDVASDIAASDIAPPWTDEIDVKILRAGSFRLGGRDVGLREATFFHRPTRVMVVTDCIALIPDEIPPLIDPAKLLLVGKRSTADQTPTVGSPGDTPEARLAGWKKMTLLINYFFPEHEEPAPNAPGVVEWSDGWEDNFAAISGRLFVPPVVRSLLYAQDPAAAWADAVAEDWFESTVESTVRGSRGEEAGADTDTEGLGSTPAVLTIVPAHWDGPVENVGLREFLNAYRWLDDPNSDPFPEADMARGLQPVIDAVFGTKTKADESQGSGLDLFFSSFPTLASRFKGGE